ncbi:MAG: UDP-N-acetylglucosamine--N-acetylmuramyl-(pentapeptide) pyrophosphoryl-undecaprenol N-acetylglucosamine transferase [Planctomycetota bacterium]|nr:MAG: UDP-N-acetylglucosamine--N-acetylmuramyl-(pentapeptide) pyrophosphoryl-undecaprenol N-acetylglucosamine transferase [Planctomycetota bacterium]
MTGSTAARGEGGGDSLRLAFAGGGTGGHIVPGMHLLDHVLGRGSSLADLLWFHSGRAVEERVMHGLAERLGGTPLEKVELAVEAGRGVPGRMRLAARTPGATIRARRALARHRTEVLLGLGGYTMVPAVLAARSLGIPVALLEINASAGQATRVLAPLARVVFHAWPATLPARGGARHVLSGPPVAAACAATGRDADARAAARAALGCTPGRPVLAVFGGSQGAQGLNTFVRDHADAMLARGVQVLHQVGPGRLAEARRTEAHYRAVEYADDVPLWLTAADLVLCRGGASTLAELAATRTPAWVVPYPHHADRHQERNARELGGGVRIVPEETLDAELAHELARLLGEEGADERARMSAALEAVLPGDAAERIAAGLFALRA